MSEPVVYEIVIRGRATRRILGTLADDFVIDARDTGHTRLTGEIRDPSHLHGVINELTSLAIEIVSITTTTTERQP